MTNLTRNGVCKNLTNSPYVFTELIDDKQIDFHFSSVLHLNNFKEKRTKNYAMLYNYLYKRFKFKCNCRLLADCNLYQKVETRGFYIKYDEKVYLCPSNMILNGESKMKKNLEEWQEILTTSLDD